ncbi:MAG: pilus assembly protein N-terminal domain-containing protein [Acidobacteriota bacterium]
MFCKKTQADRSARFRAMCGLAALVLVAASPALRAQSTAEEIRITLGKSIVIDYPVDVARISTSNPEIVDAVAVSTREVLLHAKAHGICTIVVWSKTGQRTFYNISVEHNLEPIRRILKETFPNDPIQIQSARDSITLVGTVSSQAVADRATALAASLSKTVINNLQITPVDVEKQILLRVKFAELNRSAAMSFGVNIFSTGALGMLGSTSTGQFSGPRPEGSGSDGGFSVTDALNVFAFRPELNLGATIKALQAEGILQIIAEPNLVTTNGKEASFLVGGEFPVPVLQGGANSGAVTIQFREFGIRLTFNPQLTTHSTLKMYVKPEVSTIDLANAVTLSGFTIPALATRRMETNIELGPGQSFVIGGLIDDRVTDQMSKIPGLSGIPVLGSLFKSREERKTKTELLVMVTPEIVDPLNPSDPKPIPVMPHQFLPPVQIKPTSQKGNVDPVKAKARKLRAKDNFAPVPPPTAITAAQPVPAAVEPVVEVAKDAPKTGGDSH